MSQAEEGMSGPSSACESPTMFEHVSLIQTTIKQQ